MPLNKYGFATDPNLAKALESEDTGTLSAILRYISRPGYAFRSLLAGEPVNALENVGQFLLDTPTFGMIDRRLSLANLFSDTGDITDDSERPEATDVLHAWGGAHPASRGFGANLAIDVIGGLVDPLTLLTGPTRSLAQGSLTGLTRSAAQKAIAGSLRATPKGLAALEGASSDVLRGVMGKSRNLDVVTDAGFASRPTRLARLLEEAGGDVNALALSPARKALLNRGLEGRAAERVFGGEGFRFAERSDELANSVRNLREFEDVVANPASPVDAFPRYRQGIQEAQQALVNQTEQLDAGIQRLKASGHLAPGTGVRFAGHDVPEFWKVMGEATLPGLARRALLSFDRTRPIGEAVETAAQSGYDWLRASFVDKTQRFAGKIPAGLARSARETAANHVAEGRRIDRRAQEMFEGISPDGRKAFGEILLRHEGELGTKIWASQAGGKAPDLKAALGALRQDLLTIPGVTTNTVDNYLAEMGKVKTDLQRLGIFKKFQGIENPLYVPHMAAGVLSDLIAEGWKNSKITDEVKDVFTKRREYRTAEDFTRALNDVAARFGINVDGLGSIVETDIATLFRERLHAHARTVARGELTQKARRLGAIEGDPLTEYVKFQLAPTSRDSLNPVALRAVSKVIGGGKFRIDATDNPALQAWGKRTDGYFNRTVKSTQEGRKFVEVDFKGLASVWKPLQTASSGSLGFHTRNIISSVFLGAFDEDIGWSAGGRSVKAIWNSFLNSPVVQRATKMGLRPDESADLVKLLSDNATERAQALSRLESTGKLVGGRYTYSEVAKILDGAIPNRPNMVDLDVRLGRMDVFGRELNTAWNDAIRGRAGPRLKGVLNWWIRTGMNMADAVESRFRSIALVEMLSKGVEPVEAVRKMQKAFVNYDKNSQVEALARDFLPYLRFTLGSTQWLGTLASKPRLSSWIGRVQGSAQNSQGEDSFLPPKAQESLALPLPWTDVNGNAQFLTAIGLPQEVAWNVLGLPTPDGFRKGVLGGLAPYIRTPLEASTGTSFYFNEPFGGYRRAPWYLPDALTKQITLKDGTVRREIPGEINEILGALPSGRMDSVLNQLLDPEKPLFQRLLTLTTGLRTITSDQGRELKSRIADYLKTKAEAGEVGQVLTFFAQGEVPPDLEAALKAMQELRKPKRRGFGT